MYEEESPQDTLLSAHIAVDAALGFWKGWDDPETKALVESILGPGTATDAALGLGEEG
jgi:hypothetical protein